jgi:hypothetical protein
VKRRDLNHIGRFPRSDPQLLKQAKNNELWPAGLLAWLGMSHKKLPI